MIPYLGMETLKHHTLSGNTYLSSPHIGVAPSWCSSHLKDRVDMIEVEIKTFKLSGKKRVTYSIVISLMCTVRTHKLV